MAVRVTLRCQRAIVRMRELTGADEQTITDTSTATAVALVSRLIGDQPCAAVDLPAPDRDRLLAAAYRQAFGDRLEATAACISCEEPFDLDFALSALEDSLAPSPADVRQVDDNAYESALHGQFRLPTGADEAAVVDLEPDEAVAELLRRCVAARAIEEAGSDTESLDAMLESVAPIVDLDLAANCPSCGTPWQVRFDLQSYFLGAVLADRDRLHGEVHRIATTYGWGRDEILQATRSERHALVALIEADNRAGRSW